MDDSTTSARAQVRASTFIAVAAAAGVAGLLYVVIGGWRGSLGDEGMGWWFYATGLALIGGIAGVPLAVSNVELVPRWQWMSEAAIAALAVLAAIASAWLALF